MQPSAGRVVCTMSHTMTSRHNALTLVHTHTHARTRTHTHTHAHTNNPFNGPFSETTQVSRYQNGKTNLDFTKARDSEWQWHELGHMQVCTLLQTDNHTSTPPLCFLQARFPSCCPTNSVKALKALAHTHVNQSCYWPLPHPSGGRLHSAYV